VFIKVITQYSLDMVQAVVPCECRPRPTYDMREPEEVPW